MSFSQRLNKECRSSNQRTSPAGSVPNQCGEKREWDLSTGPTVHKSAWTFPNNAYISWHTSGLKVISILPTSTGKSDSTHSRNKLAFITHTMIFPMSPPRCGHGVTFAFRIVVNFHTLIALKVSIPKALTSTPPDQWFTSLAADWLVVWLRLSQHHSMCAKPCLTPNPR